MKAIIGKWKSYEPILEPKPKATDKSLSLKPEHKKPASSRHHYSRDITPKQRREMFKGVKGEKLP